MIFEDYRKFANENPVCALATIDGDQPRVRGMKMLFCNEKGFYFTTGSMSNKYKQLLKNPKIEVYFFSPETFKSMRLEGKVEFITDMKEKEEIFNQVDWLKSIISSANIETWAPFKLVEGRIYMPQSPTSFEVASIEFNLKGNGEN